MVVTAFVCAGAGCASDRFIRTPSLSHRSQEPAPEYAGLVGTYCLTCHSDRLKTAGLSLQTLTLGNVPDHADVWEKVARKLRSGEMPPATVRSRPDARIAAELATYLATTPDL